MVNYALPCPLPLPRSWPRRVRSAVVQVVSLARASWFMPQGVWWSSSCDRFLASMRDGIATVPGGPLPGLDSHPLTHRAFLHGAPALVHRKPFWLEARDRTWCIATDRWVARFVKFPILSWLFNHGPRSV